jgi:lysophospholipase L1-like esterase
MKKLYALAAMCGMALSASAATTPPKVVFIGDFYTYLWSNAFASNPNWINEGADGLGEIEGEETSDRTLARFQSDVVALHPAVVHIMIGINDADNPSPSSLPGIPAFVVSNLDKMVQEAKAANIKVILGIEPTDQIGSAWSTLAAVNSAIANYGAANNIPIVNYGDALCGCVLELGGSLTNAGLSAVYYSTTTDSKDQQYGGVIPSATGYGLMSQMAATAIAATTTNPTRTSGYLQDIELPSNGNSAVSNVNTVVPLANVQFTAYGAFSDGSLHVLNNTNAQGNAINGTWSSSNPLVMSITQQGLALAITPGTANIHFTPNSGTSVNEWTMYVHATN